MIRFEMVRPEHNTAFSSRSLDLSTSILVFALPCMVSREGPLFLENKIHYGDNLAFELNSINA